MGLKNPKRVGFYFFSSHTQELRYEPPHPLVVNGGNILSVLRHEKLEYITCYRQYGLIINNLNKLK